MNARGDQQVLVREDSPSSGSRLDLTLAIAEYDRTAPLIHGRVVPDGIRLGVTTEFEIGDFCHQPIYERFDLAEMSFSWYVAARCRDEPVIALPVFPLRMPLHAYLFCRTDSPYANPGDLKGKRIATKQYRLTVNLWARGMFQDGYGVDADQVQWVTREPEGAGFEVPRGIKLELVTGQTAEQLLLAGEVDAMISATIPRSFLQGDPRIRRLFPDARAEMQRFVAEKGFMPVTHTVAMKASLAKDKPWVARSMVRAFAEAQRVCDDLNLEPKRYSHGDGVFFLEDQRRAYGKGIYDQGFAANRKVVETFVRYAHEQGYIARRPEVEELFAPDTLSL